jgi:hypothetical protein
MCAMVRIINVVHGRLLCDHDQLVWLPIGSRCVKMFGITSCKNSCYLVDVEDVNKVMDCTNQTIFRGNIRIERFIKPKSPNENEISCGREIVFSKPHSTYITKNYSRSLYFKMNAWL